MPEIKENEPLIRFEGLHNIIFIVIIVAKSYIKRSTSGCTIFSRMPLAR